MDPRFSLATYRDKGIEGELQLAIFIRRVGNAIREDQLSEKDFQAFTVNLMKTKDVFHHAQHQIPELRMPQDVEIDDDAGPQMRRLVMGFEKYRPSVHSTMKDWSNKVVDTEYQRDMRSRLENMYQDLSVAQLEDTKIAIDNLMTSFSYLLKDPRNRLPATQYFEPSISHPDSSETNIGFSCESGSRQGDTQNQGERGNDEALDQRGQMRTLSSSLRINDLARPQNASAATKTGLRNGGNTCYQNALIQFLIAAQGCVSALNTWTDDGNFISSPVEIAHFVGLIRYVAQKRFQLSTQMLTAVWEDIDRMAKDEENTYRGERALTFCRQQMLQQDAADFFSFALEYLLPPMHNVFEILKVKIEKRCKTCGHSSLRTVEPLDRRQIINIAIPDGRSRVLHLENLLPFGKWVDGEETCSKDPRHKISQSRETMVTFPKNLVLQILRFEFVDETETWKKTDFINCLSWEIDIPDSPYEYILRAIVCHMGDGSDSGHYYALTRKGYGEFAPWIRWDDSDKQVVMDWEEIVTEDAYLLLLERGDRKHVLASDRARERLMFRPTSRFGKREVFLYRGL